MRGTVHRIIHKGGLVLRKMTHLENIISFVGKEKGQS